jgi:hypothetical protein
LPLSFFFGGLHGVLIAFFTLSIESVQLFAPPKLIVRLTLAIKRRERTSSRQYEANFAGYCVQS